MALLRDVPFGDYGSHPVAAAAAADLTGFGADFKGAKNNSGVVRPQLLFRGVTPGDKVGPYLSQYFYLPCFFGSNEINQRIVTAAPYSTAGNNGAGGGRDYLTTYGDWLHAQRGGATAADIFDGTPRYIRMGRDISQWVHIDVLFQGYFQAFLVLAGLGAPVDAGNPYNGNPTQAGFATFGGPHIATLLCEVSTRALHAVWYQKWMVHRRLRPDRRAEPEAAGLLHLAVQPDGRLGRVQLPERARRLPRGYARHQPPDTLYRRRSVGRVRPPARPRRQRVLAG
jgi:hypothetical protein